MGRLRFPAVRCSPPWWSPPQTCLHATLLSVFCHAHRPWWVPNHPDNVGSKSAVNSSHLWFLLSVAQVGWFWGPAGSSMVSSALSLMMWWRMQGHGRSASTGASSQTPPPCSWSISYSWSSWLCTSAKSSWSSSHYWQLSLPLDGEALPIFLTHRVWETMTWQQPCLFLLFPDWFTGSPRHLAAASVALGLGFPFCRASPWWLPTCILSSR